MESRDNVEIRRQQCTWAPVIEMDGAPITYDSTIRQSSRGHSMYLAQALEQPLLLPKDMDVLRRMRQPDLVMSLKRDLAIVSMVSSAIQFVSLFHSHIFFRCNPLVALYKSLNKSLWPKNASKTPTINPRPSLISGARWRRRSGLSRKRRPNSREAQNLQAQTSKRRGEAKERRGSD